MRTHLTPSARWLAGVIFVFLLQPTRCGLPTVNFEAAEIRPAIIITEGKTSEGFPYLFGGVSSNEREAMEERAKDYNVKLVFAAKDGSFISGVAVRIATAKGVQIAAVATDGPWFYIQLPAGIYSVRATLNGETRQIKELRVTKDKMVQQGFVWDLGKNNN
jgi:hypothetical protein